MHVDTYIMCVVVRMVARVLFYMRGGRVYLVACMDNRTGVWSSHMHPVSWLASYAYQCCKSKTRTGMNKMIRSSGDYGPWMEDTVEIMVSSGLQMHYLSQLRFFRLTIHGDLAWNGPRQVRTLKCRTLFP